MTTFKQAMQSAGLRPVDFRNLMETLTGYRPPAATVTRWLQSDGKAKPGAMLYAIALLKTHTELKSGD